MWPHRRCAKAGLDVDPGHEWELLHPLHNVPVDNLVLGPAADSILLLDAFKRPSALREAEAIVRRRMARLQALLAPP